MKFEKIEPGMLLYDVHKHRAGNTTLMTVGIWSVRVISVDREKRTAMCSWNSNPPKTFYLRELERFRATKPVLVKSGFTYRLQTPAERKAADAASNNQEAANVAMKE